MIEPILNLVLQNLTSVSLWIILGLVLLLVSSKERSYKVSLSSLETQITNRFDASAQILGRRVEDVSSRALTTLQSNLELAAEETLTKVDGMLIERVKELKTDFNEWITASLPGLGDELVKKPLTEILQSQLMSRLGVASGESRRGKAAANELLEDALPPGLIIIRDQLIKQVPSLKSVLKDPGKILQVAQTFGIDVTKLSGESSNSSSSSRW